MFGQLVRRLGSTRLGKPLNPPTQDSSFESQDYVLFRNSLHDSRRLLEFGSGHSTCWVSKRFDLEIRSLETDRVWADKVKQECGDRAEVIYVDVGPVGDYGTPLSFEKREMFSKYLEVGFDGYSPDMVYIDGRFRVAAFMSSLILAVAGTRIIFDDYPYRPLYHVVEEIISPVEKSARQALFIRPAKISLRAVRELMHSFQHVFE